MPYRAQDSVRCAHEPHGISNMESKIKHLISCTDGGAAGRVHGGDGVVSPAAQRSSLRRRGTER
jgi:hypothetical protein